MVCDNQITMTVYYSADLHVGHRNILTHVPTRPWGTVEEMNAGLVDRWNAVVDPDDEVWLLGDVSLSPSKLGIVRQLNGRIRLVAGNHDTCWTGHRRHAGQRQRYLDAGFTEVHESGVVRNHLLGDDPATARRVTLAHFPYEGDHTDRDRYSDQRPADDRTPLLCGHVHDAWQTRPTAAGTPQINVGVDVWDWTPVPADRLLRALDT